MRVPKRFSKHIFTGCLMAIPYNLMHILIEDGVAEPGDWWYAAPEYIPQEGKISADPNKKSKL